jgi:hypothetical protein
VAFAVQGHKYLAAIESLELFEKCPQAIGEKIIIELVPKFASSENAKNFVEKCGDQIRSLGFDLKVRRARRFRIEWPNGLN